MTPAAVVRRILFYGLITLLSLFFALPLLWLVLAPVRPARRRSP